MKLILEIAKLRFARSEWQKDRDSHGYKLPRNDIIILVAIYRNEIPRFDIVITKKEATWKSSFFFIKLSIL